jgi:hypothetical protein
MSKKLNKITKKIDIAWPDRKHLFYPYLSRIKNKEYQGKQTVGDLVNKREEL